MRFNKLHLYGAYQTPRTTPAPVAITPQEEIKPVEIEPVATPTAGLTDEMEESE
jgi:hypothetical protein